MNAVINKIEAILKSEYDIKNYIDLIREIFPQVNIGTINKLREEKSNFLSHIKGSVHIGNYIDPDKKKIVIMAVQLQNAGYVERARSTQRSFAKKIIENANADAAFIAYYTENDPKWRLSLVRLDYEMKIENGRLKSSENLTPAKRFSYLVGENEPCHTAISRFERFIIDSNVSPEHPTLDDLENAFSVEKVTDEFFKLYCEKFHQLRENLETNEDFRVEAEHRNFTSAQFAKKLMGQIVFLYFLQKKGWLGVNAWPDTLTEKEYKKALYARGAKSRELIPLIYRLTQDGIYRISSVGLNNINDNDEAVLATCVKGKPWGSGPHNFMRKLYDLAEKKGQNFFDDYLEPLFYDALNVNRGEQGYCPALHCRIPFLSGGLFEPIDGYDWKYNNFAIPNEVFSNASTKGREADGILDIFDRYNFTMCEDEPMEREVAIDPEMLGKVFENLLEVQDRKSKGAFYTPREIVHYMCQESLINYLTTNLNIEENAIREFILYGDFMKDEDTVKNKVLGKSSMLISESLFKLDNDGKFIVNRLLDVDAALKNVRVADPAVGSGAFPLGMLNEIVRVRQNISAYLAINMNSYEKMMMLKTERSPWQLKYDTIKNCIFAADIEPSAVDIAQLRLWLSLVIDDEINPNAQSDLDGHRNPLPLPNLECNILCGNSLVDEFEGTRLIKESDLFGDEAYQIDINHGRYETVVKKLIEKQNELFRCDNTETKKLLKEEIANLRDVIIMEQLEGCDSNKLQRYVDTKRLASKPYVLWQLDFARVFKEKGGFDIVIGNPPYVGEKGNKDIFRVISLTELGKRFQIGKMDLFYYFFHKGIDLLRPSGILGFITTNYYITATAGRNLRMDFYERTDIVKLINFNECKIFESALGQHNMITLLKKGHSNSKINIAITEETGYKINVVNEILKGTNKRTVYATLNQKEIYEGDNYYIRFSRLSEMNESIFNKMVNNKCLGEYCHINLGCHCVLSKITNKHIKTYGNTYTQNEGVYVISKEESKKFDNSSPSEKARIKPFIKNSNISRWNMKLSDMKFIYLRWEDDIDSFPDIKKHLERFKKIRTDQIDNYGEKNWPWYAIHRPREQFLFEKGEKILLPYRSKRNTFAFTEEEVYASGDVFYILLNDNSKKILDLKYILALLNSELYYFWLYHKGKRKGDILEMYWQPLTEIPILLATKEIQKEISQLTERLIAGVEEVDKYEKKINEIIYQIYGLTFEEINIVKDLYNGSAK